MLTLTSKYEGKLGVMRTYHHPLVDGGLPEWRATQTVVARTR